MLSLFGPSIEKLKTQRDVDGLLKALDNKNDQIRAKAAEALGEMGSTLDASIFFIVITKLVDALDDKSDKVHSSSSQALGKIGAPVVESLINVVQNRQRLPVWTGIETALGLIGTPAVKPIIELLLDEPGALGGFAERTLTRIGVSSVEPLIAVLEAGSYESKQHAIYALGNIGKLVQDKGSRARVIAALVAITENQGSENIRLCAAASHTLHELTGEDFTIGEWKQWLDKQK